MPPMNPIIELDGLSVAFGRREILHDLRLSLSGRAIGLLGPNGAGKTTLIHTLLGFHAPSRGRAMIFGEDIGTHARQIRARVGYMPERDAFIAGMSAVHFVKLMAELSGLPSEAALERAHEALFFVGLGEARYRALDTYSLGMKQMAKLAQAIVHGPQLIILDEPTNGLDPPARQRMLDMIKKIRDGGHAQVLFSSHLLRDVEECCEEVLILKDGNIAAYCDLEKERRSNVRAVEIETRGDGRGFAEAARAIGCGIDAANDRRMRLILGESVGVSDLFKLAADRGVQLRRLNFKRDSLEEIFLKAMENGHGGL